MEIYLFYNILIVLVKFLHTGQVLLSSKAFKQLTHKHI